MLEEYGERDENSNLIYSDGGIKIKPEHMNEILQKINQLNSVEIEFDFSLTYEEVAKCNFDIQDLVFLKENVL